MKNLKKINSIPDTLPFAAIIVASLGYFVDIYDLLLFSIVRLPSLTSLGLTGPEATSKGILLLNIQMIGLMLGGIFWGLLGDKKGRLTVLFGSILIYSLANIANGMISNIEGFAICRFVAGFGLAGELGAGVTLVVELMPTAKRGYATTIIAGVGILGAVVAHFMADIFHWRIAFFVGGGLGMALLLLRIGVSESSMFYNIKNLRTTSTNPISLMFNKGRFKRYVKCILIGLPLWFGVGILITLSPEFARAMHVQGEVSAGLAIACCYGGSVIGDICSGMLSQRLKSRKSAVYVFLCMLAVAMTVYLCNSGLSPFAFYSTCIFFGFAAGYWVLFITIAAEQFGTNIRSTVTTTAPNFVRGAVVPLSLLFELLRSYLNLSILLSGAFVGALTLALAFYATYGTEETFSSDLDYVEE